MKQLQSSSNTVAKAATQQLTEQWQSCDRAAAKQQRSADHDFSYVTWIVRPNGCISSFGRIRYTHAVVRGTCGYRHLPLQPSGTSTHQTGHVSSAALPRARTSGLEVMHHTGVQRQSTGENCCLYTPFPLE